MDLAIKCLVSNPDGSPYFEQSNKWWGLDDQAIAWFEAKLWAHLQKGLAAAGKGEDSGNYTALLSATGKPDTPITHLSYNAIVKLEREWWKLQDELIKLAEEKAKHKK